VGIDALFVEVHLQPDSALCNGSNMLELKYLPHLLKQIKSIDRMVKDEISQ